ncbi:hypothetical protein RB195_001890 [Necator americanus]|uniref:Reverse transcriptase domain-containing protein n=3 Tax=Necator americanus TaxID=51031 RepID=A0ABR1DGX9_NECAM
MLRGSPPCVEHASKPRTTNLDRISKTIKELLERRRALRLDPNASHIERDLREHNIPLAAWLSEDGTRTSSRPEMEITERFYSNLFRSSTPVSSPIIPTEGAPPRILPSEKERISDQWKTSQIVLIHKKGDREDLRNYRPICLLSVMQGFSCLDHIQTVSRVIEACREYRLPLVLTFVDYEKAFDSVETNTILSALVDQGVDASKYAYCEDGGVQLEGSQIVETSSYVYLGRSMNIDLNLKEELNRRMRAAWAAFAPVREATDHLTDQDLRAHLFDSTVLPALCYAAETLRTQHLAGLRSSDLRGMSRLRDPAEYVSKAKHRWASHIMRRIDDRRAKRTLEWIPRDAKRPRGRPPTKWGDVFVTRMDQLRAQLDTAQEPRQRHSRNLRTSWMRMAK